MTSGSPFDISPYAQSSVVKSPNIFNLNYTNQDFWSMKTRLIEYNKQQFSKEFSDFVESSLAIMLIENFSFLADTLSFKIDQIAQEIFIDTVTELENGFRLSKQVGFHPQPPIAASSMWTATINNPILTDIAIPAPLDIKVQSGTQNITIELYPADSNNNPIYDQDIIIPAGNIVNASVVGLEGRTRTQNVVSTGTVGQTLQLAYFPVIFDSVLVDVDGVRWTQVEFFTDSQPRREFRVEFDSTYTAYVIFGNNRAGLLPSQGSAILATYRQGGGVVGNVVTGFVQSQTVVDVPGLGYSVPVNFRNYTSGSNGYDGDTLEDIREKLPAWVATQLRCVTGLDYKNTADQYATPYNGSIGKSTAVLRNYGCSGNIIDLYVLARSGPNGLVPATNELKTSLQEHLADLQMFTDHVCVRDGFVLDVDVTVDVVLSKFYRKFEDEFRIRVQRRLDQFFGLNGWDYGQTLRDTDIIKVMSDINEVTRYETSFVTNDADNGGSTVVADFNEIIRPDVVTIAFIYE